MSLVGTYKFVDENNQFPNYASLEITEATIRNGQGKGVITSNSKRVNVNIHFHFKNSSGPETCLYLAGGNDSGDMLYVASAAYIPDHNNPREMPGGISMSSAHFGGKGLAGKWVRQ